MKFVEKVDVIDIPSENRVLMELLIRIKISAYFNRPLLPDTIILYLIVKAICSALTYCIFVDPR